mgnify:CR=1 FL=1
MGLTFQDVHRTLGGRTFFATASNPQDPAGTAFANGRVVRLVPQLGDRGATDRLRAGRAPVALHRGDVESLRAMLDEVPTTNERKPKQARS